MSVLCRGINPEEKAVLNHKSAGYILRYLVRLLLKGCSGHPHLFLPILFGSKYFIIKSA